tara:strand:- start:17 stop:445 length:429 start_codon:yes stop_codon:yes gene_type:complete
MLKHKVHPFLYAGLDTLSQKLIRAYVQIDRDELHIIADVCCAEYDVTPSQFRGKSREAILSDARKTFYHLCRKELYTFTCKRLGMYMDRDHSSVVHAVQRAEILMEVDPDFRVRYKNIRDKSRQVLYRNGYAYKGSKLTLNT